MFDQYVTNVKATIAFLKQCKVNVNNATVNETLQNHPDWPSMLCISDSLTRWNITNGAGKIEVNKIGELPTPFIAFTHDKEAPLAIVTNVNEEIVQAYQKNYSKPVTENREEFIKKWNGVYLIAEPNEHSGEANYAIIKQKAFFHSLVPVVALLAVMLLSFVLLNNIIGNMVASAAISLMSIYLQYFILLAGIAVTSLLLWYEFDKNNPLLQKVCTGIVKGNCNAILSGKQATVFSWLSWSEVGFFYFTGALLTIIFSGNAIANYISVIAWINILALPYIVFSIYYQWRVAKQWCVLCLAVQAFLLLGGVNVFTNSFLYPLPKISFLLIANFLLLFLLPALIWYAVKPFILRLQEAKNTKREYLRIKFNADIFETLLKKQKALTISAEGLGIDLGNSTATNTIIKVCNPYCGPCAKAHPKIEALLEQNTNVKAKIIFSTPNDESNAAIKPVRHLLAIAEKGNNEEKIKQSLDDWYLPETKNYELFAAKYPMNGELLKQGNKIAAMDKWCKTMDIHYTPTIFINGYQLPDAYTIEDLHYFLLE